MKAAELLQARRANWQELESLCRAVAKGRAPPADVARFAALYRGLCADLALADAYQLPPGTVGYLNQLLGRAHNVLYRSRRFRVGQWAEELFSRVPARLMADNYLRLAFVLFWGLFLLSAALAWLDGGFAERMVGKEMISELEDNFSRPLYDHGQGGMLMAGFYIWNNTGIGLRCFAFGLVFGIGGLFTTAFNAAFLGAAFGHMAATPQWRNFYEFVTGHGPFELTAIVLSAAAGMRLGFALVDTGGLARGESLRVAGREATPAMGSAMAMFFLAALVEAFVSPTNIPYAAKAAVAIGSTALLIVYFFVLGNRGRRHAAR